MPPNRAVEDQISVFVGSENAEPQDAIAFLARELAFHRDKHLADAVAHPKRFPSGSDYTNNFQPSHASAGDMQLERLTFRQRGFQRGADFRPGKRRQVLFVGSSDHGTAWWRNR